MSIIKNYVDHCIRLLSEVTRLKMHIDIPDELHDIASIFAAANAQCFLVGGAVRDAVMGKTPKDFDIATNVSPDEVIRIMRPHKEYKLLDVGKSFGVVIIVAPNDEQYEVATFRKDIGVGRRPDSVEFVDIEQDVKRRDLTINALFYDLVKHEIVDFVGGFDDIKNNVVRTVGEPEDRFNEDRLRILRAFRFAARMGAQLDPATATAIHYDNSLRGISPERIRDEFLKGVKSAKNVVNFLQMLEEFDMFGQILPNLLVDKHFADTRCIPVLLATLLRDNDRRFIESTLNSIKYSAEEVKQVSFLLLFMKFPHATPSPMKMKKMFHSSGLSSHDLFEFSSFVGTPNRNIVSKFIDYEPMTSGEELLSLGFKNKALGDEMERRELQRWIET